MQDFKYFSKPEIKTLQKELTTLQGIHKSEDRLITGFNYYFEAIEPKVLIIAISFLHRAKTLKKEFNDDLKSKPYACKLLSDDRKREIPFERKKRAIYRANPDFIIQRDIETGGLDKDTIYFDLLTYEEIPREFKEEAKEVLDLLRERASSTATRPWTGADAIPCIILGKDIEEFLGEKLPDFIGCDKTCIIKENDEVSFLTHNTTPFLFQHESYNRLKTCFGDLMNQVPVYANKTFVQEYIDSL